MSLPPVRVDDADLSPVAQPCARCGSTVELRLPGLCPDCTDELRTRARGEARAVDATYEPKMNVTPNAVAVKDD